MNDFKIIKTRLVIEIESEFSNEVENNEETLIYCFKEDFMNSTFNISRNEKGSLKEQYNVKFHTPSTPTEEEVCKAILEEDKSFTEVEYIFNNDNGEMDFLIHEGIWNFWLSDYTITINFKGSTITMIGQFYESELNK